MNGELLQGGQGRTPNDLWNDAKVIGVLIAAALILMMLAGCNAYVSRLWGA